jgi:F-type H+-transporting ATPase subunit epsilon
MQVEFVTPQKPIYSGPAEQVQVPTSEHGLIGIMDHHQPLFAQLSSGKVSLHINSQVTDYDITGGFVSVDSNIVRILAD